MKSFSKNKMKYAFVALLASSLYIQGCGEKEADNEIDPAVVQMSQSLEAVERDFLPAPLELKGTAAEKISQKTEEDICGDDDLFTCQPKLLKFYVQNSKQAFAFARIATMQAAFGLGRLPDGSSGQVRVEKDNVDIIFNKRSALDFEILVKKDGQSLGYIKSNNKNYHIQYDLDKDVNKDPNSLGGKIDIAVTYTGRKSWVTDVLITDVACNPIKVKDPRTARIKVERENDKWTGSATWHSDIAGNFSSDVSCNTPGSDEHGLVTYTEFVSNNEASRGALYIMKQNESSTNNIAAYGVNQLCANYEALCQAMGESFGLPTETAKVTIENLLSIATNPFCIKPSTSGNAVTDWNNDCSSISQEIANKPYLATSEFIAPSTFKDLSIQLPETL